MSLGRGALNQACPVFLGRPYRELARSKELK